MYYVVIPVYNERKHIRSVLKKVLQHTKSIIIVDDGSSDNTVKIVQSFMHTNRGIKLLLLKENQGKGAAMRIGAKRAFALGAQGVVFMDGDNQHDPKHLPKFFQRLDHGEDIVIGIRIVKSKIPFYRGFGNKMGRILVIALFDLFIPDMLCGYRGLSKRGFRQVLWTSNHYGAETEMLTLIGRKQLAFTTLVVDTIYLEKYKGFSLRDGVKLLLMLPYWRFRKLR